MSKKVKLAILRARHNPALPVIPDQACIQMMMTNNARTSVLNYWADTTEGYLDFNGSELLPWVDISITPADRDANGQIPRELQVDRAYQAMKALVNRDLEGFDGFVVLVYPGRMQVPNPDAAKPNQPPTINLDFDGGAGPTVLGKEACALPVMTSNHTFMCHEVGHVLGFAHTYGVWNNGIDWDGKPPYDQGQVYGDPYDIMSSATFGSRPFDPNVTHYTGNPTFNGSSVPGWPVEPKIGMGPAPARAHVHLWDPAAIPANLVRHYQTPSGSRKLSVRLYSASARKGSPRLVVIHPANEDAQGRGRCYLEYRDTSGWDAGLDVAGKDLARRGVVAHTLADATNDGVRCWYRGRILAPVELDSDLQVNGTPLTVRVVNDDVDSGYVDLEIASVSGRGVDVYRHGSDEVIASNDTHEMGTPCGDTIVYGTWTTQSLYFYHPTTYGYGGEGAPDAKPPKITWTVGGVPVPAGSGSLDVPAAGGTFPVKYTVDPVSEELSLSSRGGEKYSVPVIARATEADGSSPTTSTSNFEPLGYYTGFRPGDLGKLDHCMSKYLRSMRLKRRDLLIPPGPDPFHQQWRDRINQARLQEVVNRMQGRYPAQALGLQIAVMLRYHALEKQQAFIFHDATE